MRGCRGARLTFHMEVFARDVVAPRLEFTGMQPTSGVTSTLIKGVSVARPSPSGISVLGETGSASVLIREYRKIKTNCAFVSSTSAANGF